MYLYHRAAVPNHFHRISFSVADVFERDPFEFSFYTRLSQDTIHQIVIFCQFFYASRQPCHIAYNMAALFMKETHNLNKECNFKRQSIYACRVFPMPVNLEVELLYYL